MDLTDTNMVQISYFGDRGVIDSLHSDEVATRAEVGRGNSGIVHLVTLLDGTRYYVKTVDGGDPIYHRHEMEINMYLSQHASSASAVSRFLAGAVKESDWQTSSTQIFQYLPGVNAHEYLRRYSGKRDEVRRAAINALRCIHAAGIVHGDISLSNIFIVFGVHGQISARFIDFGGASYSLNGYTDNLQHLDRICSVRHPR